jgi:uncharacterized membrane protein (UPF0127 family)
LRITNQTRNIVLADHAQLADTYLSRLTGLLNRTRLNQGEALIITRCQQIHMFFMRFAIDVIFIDSSNRAVGLVKDIKPWQLSAIFWQANRAIELPPGVIAKTQTVIGDQIQIFS